MIVRERPLRAMIAARCQQQVGLARRRERAVEANLRSAPTNQPPQNPANDVIG